jgi:hypothetical protein
VSNATLFLSNVSLVWNISPETKDGKGTPGVEFSKAIYTLLGNIVATADMSKAADWQSVTPNEVRGAYAGWSGAKGWRRTHNVGCKLQVDISAMTTDRQWHCPPKGSTCFLGEAFTVQTPP